MSAAAAKAPELVAHRRTRATPSMANAVVLSASATLGGRLPEQPGHELHGGGDVPAAQPRPGHLQPGAAVAGVGAHTRRDRSRGPQPPVQLQAEQGVGQLGVVVGLPAAIAALVVEIAEVEPAQPMHDAGDGDHSAARPMEQGGQQPTGEGEVAEVVGAELELNALGGICRSGTPITPALLTSTSSPSSLMSTWSASRWTESRSARSRATTSTLAPGAMATIRSRAARPRSRSRLANNTVAPLAASSRAWW